MILGGVLIVNEEINDGARLLVIQMFGILPFLLMPHIRIQSVPREELLMRALFHHDTVVQDNDNICRM